MTRDSKWKELALWALMLVGTSASAATTVEYIHTDALGSPVAVTNAAGVVIERTEYAPYGEQLNRAEDDGPGYTGHVADKTTGLNYMQQRYYDPLLQRFISTDPVAVNMMTGTNFGRYVYANNNPYRFTDPDGRQSAPWYDNPHAFPKGDIVRTAAEAIAADAAYGVGLATGDQHLQDVAIEGMRENITASDGINAAMMGVGPRGGGKTSTTYTRVNVEGVVYSGRTSGKGTPEQQVAARMNSPDHKAKTANGYGPGVVDKSSANAGAIRGREQQLINQNGGAQSQGGTSGNRINGVAPTNRKASDYQRACQDEFGC